MNETPAQIRFMETVWQELLQVGRQFRAMFGPEFHEVLFRGHNPQILDPHRPNGMDFWVTLGDENVPPRNRFEPLFTPLIPELEGLWAKGMEITHGRLDYISLVPVGGKHFRAAVWLHLMHKGTTPDERVLYMDALK